MNPEKKKIIFITVRSDFGGGPYHIDLLIKNLKEKFDIYIASPLNKPFGVEWQRTLGKDRFFELSFRSFKLKSYISLIQYIKKNKIQVLHSHGKGAGIYTRLSKKFISNTFVIHTFHGFHILNYNFAAKKLYILVERFLSRYTNLFINVSQGEKGICIKYKIFKESKSLVVYNAINLSESTIYDKKSIRRQLGLHTEGFLIVSVVRLNMQKNLKATIDIAEKLSGYKDISFLIIGEGEERKQIEDSIKNKNLRNISLLGYKNNINEYLAACDIYLSTSLWEGLPYSLIEAAAHGLPIVASNVTGNNEVVSEGENGYLFHLNNPDEAVKKILQIKNSINEQEILSKNSKRIFNEKFQLESMIKKMEEIYNSSFVAYKD